MSRWIEVLPGAGRDIRDQLFEQGVEFPCGGETLCGGCKIRVLEGDVPITPEMREVLTEAELAGGWRLGCMARVTAPVKIAVEQWSAPVLSDDAGVAFEPRDGFGAVIDLGTTTLVVQVVNLATGEVEATRAALNPQARFGADIMTRIQFELQDPGVLRGMIRETLGAMLDDAAAGRELQETWVVGNTVMHHLFCGENVEPLAAVPFRPTELGTRVFAAGELGWKAGAKFLGCVGGFVGSDLLAGLVAVGMHHSGGSMALMDLGTNGEIAVGNRLQIRCASTAAGPAFEAGRIHGGMRAGRGAIDRVDVVDGRMACHVMGGGVAVGICGSGLVDAVAAGAGTGLRECARPGDDGGSSAGAAGRHGARTIGRARAAAGERRGGRGAGHAGRRGLRADSPGGCVRQLCAGGERQADRIDSGAGDGAPRGKHGATGCAHAAAGAIDARGSVRRTQGSTGARGAGGGSGISRSICRVDGVCAVVAHGGAGTWAAGIA